MQSELRVLVTGATAGIGLATASAFLDQGAHVVAVGRRADRLRALADAHFGDVTPVVLDVANRAAVDALPEHVWDVDVVVNNAGLARGLDAMHEGDPSHWDEMIDVNVKGLLYVTRKVLPNMVAKGRGDVVNLGSVAGRWTYPGGGVYCASKHAVRALSEGLRLDLQGSGVRVMNIEPGLVETEFSLVRFDGDKTRAEQVYANADVLRPTDVAETIVWCVNRPRHVNVQELVLYPTCQASVRDVVRTPSPHA